MTRLESVEPRRALFVVNSHSRNGSQPLDRALKVLLAHHMQAISVYVA